MRIAWDPAKSARNRRERGFGFEVAALIFDGDVMERVDERFAYGEERWQAIGMAGSLLLFVVYTDRGDERQIISARVATKREREAWRTGEW